MRSAERLKDTLRSAHTSSGRTESVAEHTWRLCLLAMLVARLTDDIDQLRLLQMCVLHDLGEAIGGDIPAIHQDPEAPKSGQERADFLKLVAPLDPATREAFTDLWDEYEAGDTKEARLAKAIDKLETLIQHTQGRNPPGFDYGFNLTYGVDRTELNEVTRAIRRMVDEETRNRAGGSPPGVHPPAGEPPA
jgi:putative hydrolase of HD superfamily